MRSKLITTCLLLAAVYGLVPAGAHASVASAAGIQTPAPERAIYKFDKASDHTVVAIPAHLPVPAAATGIGPGSHLLIEFASEPDVIYGCTANFIWKPPSGTTRYLGAAGHCFVPETKTATHGPGADYNASGTSVKVCVSGCNFGGLTGFILDGTTIALGPVAYSRNSQGGVDVGNDFGIVTIPASLPTGVSLRPSVPVWGGPTSSGVVTTGGLLCLYGNGAGVGEVFPTMARAGIGMTTFADRWSADMPSAVGDSGSAVETCGQDAGGLHGFAAVGILTHLTPGAGIISGTTMSRAIAMAVQAGLTISLVPGS
jgi:hypothetical protein